MGAGMDPDLLDSLKYRELQKLAKEAGIKANLPRSALIEALTTGEKSLGAAGRSAGVADADDDTDAADAAAQDGDTGKSPLNSTFEVPERASPLPGTPVVGNDLKDPFSQLLSSGGNCDEEDDVSFNWKWSGGSRKQYSSSSSKRSPDEAVRPSLPATRSAQTPADAANRSPAPSDKPSTTSSPSGRLATKKSPFSVKQRTSNLFKSTISSAAKRRSVVAVVAAAVKSGLEIPSEASKSASPALNRRSISKSSSSANAVTFAPTLTSATLETSRKSRVMVQRPSANSSSGIPVPAKRGGAVGETSSAVATGTGNRSVRKVPNFAKLHAQEFSKMDTLDAYLEKKRKRILEATTPGGPRTGPRPETKSKRPRGGTSPAGSSCRRSRTSPRFRVAGGGAGGPPPKKTTDHKFVVDLKDVRFDFAAKAPSSAASPFKASSVSASSAKAPFVFTSKKENVPAMANDCGQIPRQVGRSAADPDKKKPLGYKPYTGRVRDWNPKRTAQERLKAAKMAATGQHRGEPGSQGSNGIGRDAVTTIKGVRLNRRAELQLLLQQRRGLPAASK